METKGLRKMLFIVALCLIVGATFGILVYNKVIFQEGDPIPIISGIIKLNFSNSDIVKISEKPEGYIIKTSDDYNPIINMMESREWKYIEQIGSGIIFSKGNDLITLSSRQFTRWYRIIKFPIKDIEILDREKFKSFYIEGPFNEELYKLQKSLSEDQVYYKIIENKEEFDKEVKTNNLHTPRMIYSLNYTKDYFRNRAILLVYPEQGSSSLSYTVDEVDEYKDHLEVLIEKYIPSEVTTDMINHGLLIEIHRESVNNPVNIKIIEEHPPN